MNTLNKKNIPREEKLDDVFLSMSLVESAKYFRSHYGIEDSVEKICKDIDDIMEYNYLNYVELKPGVSDLLFELNKLGIKMAIATSTDHYLVDEITKKLNIDKYFTYTLTCGEVGKSKQNPDIYLRVGEHFNVKPEETIIFEDLPYGIISSNSANIHTVGVYDYPSLHHQETIKKNAKLYVEHIDKETIQRIIDYIKNS